MGMELTKPDDMSDAEWLCMLMCGRVEDEEDDEDDEDDWTD